MTVSGPILIPTKQPDVLFGAARILALLAYPNLSRGIKRRNLFVTNARAMMTKRLVAIRKSARNKQHENMKEGLNLQFTGKDWRAIEKSLVAAAKRVERRLSAADIALGLLGTLPADYRSVHGAVRKQYAQGDHKRADYWQRKIWNESRTVLHIALAVREEWEFAFFDNFPEWKDRPVIDGLLGDPTWVARAITQANAIAPILVGAFNDLEVDTLIPIVAVPTVADILEFQGK